MTTKQKKYYTYSLTSPSGKQYIGYTTLEVNHRFALHVSSWKRWIKGGRVSSGVCRKLFCAFDRYAPENWSVTQLCEYISEDTMIEGERSLIEQHNSIANGYNLIPGGRGGTGKKLTQEHKERIAKARRKYFESEAGQEWKQVLSQRLKNENPSAKKRGIGKWPAIKATRPKKGTIERSKQLSDAQRKRWNKLTPEERSSLSHMKGKKQTDHQKQRVSHALSRTHKVRFPDGHIEEVFNLNSFCRDNKLSNSNIHGPSGSRGYKVML